MKPTATRSSRRQTALQAASLVLALVAAALVVRSAGAASDLPYDPLAKALATAGQVVNLEATVPPQCYTKTGGTSNPCWTCHTVPHDPNFRQDLDLQREYDFSPFATTNRWLNLFQDRSAAIAAIGDPEILAHIRGDNYGPLRAALSGRADFPGYLPDLDLGPRAAAFDLEGFARDGSGWRALRFKPFPGNFWPTNGNTDDVMIRLPAAFRRTAEGVESREIYKLNLAILEAAIAAPPRRLPGALDRAVEPVDEAPAGFDLDGNGKVGGRIEVIRTLPPSYAGAAAVVAVQRYLYPRGVEFLHTVRYLDPDEPTLLSRHLKELRYSRKQDALDIGGLLRAEERAADEKDEGIVPLPAGSAPVGLRNAQGWQLQGFIEDERGRLRLQTDEEHRTCVGCHGGLGVTVDQTFTMARKVPGLAGWRPQDLRGMPDAPQAGHREPEVLTYLRRVGAGDELRANTEMIDRFVRQGRVDDSAWRRGGKGKAADLAELLYPSRRRALELDKAYLVLVRDQAFALGREPRLAPPVNVHRTIENAETDLGKSGKIYTDGVLWLDW